MSIICINLLPFLFYICFKNKTVFYNNTSNFFYFELKIIKPKQTFNIQNKLLQMCGW